MNFTNVQNYQEQLVFTEVAKALASAGRENEEELAEDVACVALNNLPPRYVHHNVYLAFYLSTEDREKMLAEVKEAVREAILVVDIHKR